MPEEGATARRRPKSELHSKTPTHIRFDAGGGSFVVEKNVGQRTFADSPGGKTDFVAFDTGDTYYLNRHDTEQLWKWLGEALGK